MGFSIVQKFLPDAEIPQREKKDIERPYIQALILL